MKTRKSQLGFIGNAITKSIISMVIAAFMFGAALFYGVPWIWTIVKPFIHAWTA